MKRRVFFLIAVLSACSGGSEPSVPANAGELFEGGTPDPCQGVNIEPLAWDADTPLGMSAEQRFAPLAGECHSTLRWDAPGLDGTQSGETPVTVRLELDDTSARLSTPKSGASSCPSALLVNGHAALSTEDGTFVDDADVTLAYRAAGAFTFGFARDLNESGGTFDLDLKERESAQLQYRFDGAASTCSGEISLGINSRAGNFSKGSLGRLASWSNSGCPVGESSIRLDEPASDGGPSVLESIANALSEVTFAGVWDDGQPTSMRLTVKNASVSACADMSKVFTSPVEVEYGTEDGRMVSHRVHAEIRGTSLGFNLWIDDRLDCADENDTLPYTRKSCAHVRAVQAQLGINYNAGEVSFSDDGLLVYEYDRASKASAGAADRVRKLELTTPP